MQVCHGKAAPLKRIQPGDRIVYYSPTSVFRGKDRLQSLTAIGVAKDVPPYQADMDGGFSPFRRDVTWCSAEETPIKPLVGFMDDTGVTLASGSTYTVDITASGLFTATAI